MTDLHLRSAQVDDMERCAKIFNDWVDQTAWMPRVHPHDDVLGYYQTVLFDENDITLAERNSRLVGFLAQKGEHIDALYIGRSARRRGIGHALMSFAMSQAQALSLWTFRANREARAFYRRQGFSVLRTTEGENEEGLPDLLLGWRKEATV